MRKGVKYSLIQCFSTLVFCYYNNKKTKSISLQSHTYRKKYWFCIGGKGQAQSQSQTQTQLDSNLINLELNTKIFIDIKQIHKLINNSDSNLEIIEVQLGIYLGGVILLDMEMILMENNFQIK